MLDANIVSFRGRLLSAVDYGTEAGGGFPASSPALESLTAALYQTHYCKQIPHSRIPKAAGYDYIHDLRAANNSSRKNAATRRGRVLLPKWEDHTSQPGFYYAIGDELGDPAHSALDARIYLHVEGRCAAKWMGLVTAHLNRYLIPFSIKILRYAVAYARIDSAVLYLPRRFAPCVARLLQELSLHHRGLRPVNLPFTKTIIPGLSLADDPPHGESFGLSRMRFVARGLLRAQYLRSTTPAAIAATVAEVFEEERIDPQTPWLNPQNADYGLDLSSNRAKPPVSSQNDQWTDAADRIGCRLIRDAITYDKQSTWIDWTILPDTEGSRQGMATLGPDFYSGTSGIALFLDQLYRATGYERYQATARSAMNFAMDQIERATIEPGFYSGHAGVIYTWLKARDHFDDRRTTRFMSRLVGALLRAELEPWQTDIIVGRAGLLNLLIAVANKVPHLADEALGKAISLGDELLSLAVLSGDHCSWKSTSVDNPRNLLGYAHGASGIASALINLFSVTNEKRFLDVASQGMNYERLCFDDQANNWPDYRGEDLMGAAHINDNHCMTAWCNGAPGTLYALASLERFAQSLSFESEDIIRRALSTTISSIRAPHITSGHNFSLCHGIAGNAYILSSLQIAKYQKRIETAVSAAAQSGAAKFGRSLSWPCGLPEGSQTLGMMMGLAGIGYFYLRMRDKKVPCPLFVS